MRAIDTAEQRASRVRLLQDNTQALYNLLVGGRIEVEQARLGLELIQLSADLIDISDSLARRTQVR
jgi:hypothetical protein